jgi:thymidylate synthase ThyX
MIAVLFAYYSRSPGSLKESLARMLGEEGIDLSQLGHIPPQLLQNETVRKFHERYVVAYGHSSVAEHAVAHVALENVSILAAKAIEDCRLAAYTEKSTRYVPWTPAVPASGFVPVATNVMVPPEIRADPEAHRLYNETTVDLFARYSEIRLALAETFKQETPKENFKTETGWKNACAARALDLTRGLLPAGSKTSLGITVNAREYAHMLRKLLSSPLAEVRGVGEQMHAEGLKVLPTLVRHVEENKYRLETRAALTEIWETLRALKHRKSAESPFMPGLFQQPRDVVILRGPTSERAAVFELATFILYEIANETEDLSYDQVRWILAHMGYDRILGVVNAYLDKRGTWDAPGRALEHLLITTEFICDYGAWWDIQRHHMGAQAIMPLSWVLASTLADVMDLHRPSSPSDGPHRPIAVAALQTWSVHRPPPVRQRTNGRVVGRGVPGGKLFPRPGKRGAECHRERCRHRGAGEGTTMFETGVPHLDALARAEKAYGVYRIWTREQAMAREATSETLVEFVRTTNALLGLDRRLWGVLAAANANAVAENRPLSPEERERVVRYTLDPFEAIQVRYRALRRPLLAQLPAVLRNIQDTARRREWIVSIDRLFVLYGHDVQDALDALRTKPARGATARPDGSATGGTDRAGQRTPAPSMLDFASLTVPQRELYARYREEFRAWDWPRIHATVRENGFYLLGLVRDLQPGLWRPVEELTQAEQDQKRAWLVAMLDAAQEQGLRLRPAWDVEDCLILRAPTPRSS